MHVCATLLRSEKSVCAHVPSSALSHTSHAYVYENESAIEASDEIYTRILFEFALGFAR